MEPNVLTLAKQYQDQHKWNEAIACFEQYMHDNETCSETIYTSYARCLRMNDQTDRAIAILRKGHALYPQSESILVEFLYIYEYLRDWEAIKMVAGTLIDMNPEKADYYFKRGRAYAYLHEKKQAEQTYKTGLTYQHGLSFESLVEKIQKGFTDQPGAVTSKYTFLGGKNNLGSILHEYHDRKYFTKISKLTRGAQREKTFYKDLCTQFPGLKKIVPGYVDSQTMDHVQYLTMEMIESARTTKPLEKIIKVSQHVSALRYQDMIEKDPNPDFSFSLKSRPYYIVIFFTQIHKEYYNQKLFAALKRFTQQNRYPEKAGQVVQHLQSLIMNHRLYTFINPEKHYSLLHGDFQPSNIKMKKEDAALCLFDWNNFIIGPHFMDMARYLVASSTSYSDVKGMYLFSEKPNRNLSLIEQIFFLYAFILMHFVTLQNKSVDLDQTLSEIIYPALADMEACVSRFKQDETGFSEFIVRSLLSDNETTLQENGKLQKKISKLQEDHKKASQENVKLKKEISNLKKERTKAQVKLQNILNSRSWKITAPLRKVMRRK